MENSDIRHILTKLTKVGKSILISDETDFKAKKVKKSKVEVECNIIQ